MTQILLKGNPIDTIGTLPPVDTEAPGFCLVKTDLSDLTLESLKGKAIVLNIFPSLDTPVCAASVRRFNQEASGKSNTVVVCISADLPFAHQRFCEAEGLEDVVSASVFRSPDFGKAYGVTISTGPLAGLLSRALVIIDPSSKVVYTEQVPEIAQEPDYAAALEALESI
ncbi:MAG TPA: thiol peroxidase [Desulfobacteraceae bacterium]|nr:thiol peroxidase [Desulfobacteraceae bacterium]